MPVADMVGENMRRWGFAAIVLMGVTGQAVAAEPAVPVPALQDICGAQQAGPFRFGETRAGASLRSGRARVSLDPGYAPFASASVRTTNWSDVAMLVEFRAAIADPEAGLAAEEAVAEALEKGGWNRLGDAPGEPAPFDPDLADANRIFSRTIGEGGQDALLYAGLSWRGGQLTLICAHADLLALDKLEAGGLLPDDAPRPAPPPPVTASPIAVARCGDADAQARAAAMFDGGSDPYVDQVGDQRDYWDRLARWQRWRLEKSGKADAARLDDVQFAAEEASRAAIPGDPLAAMGGLLESIPALDEARKSGDPGRICGAYAKAVGFMVIDLEQRTEQSKRVSEAWVAEAARLGVGLD